MTSNPLPPLARKPGTVGIGQGVSIRILALDSDTDVPEGEVAIKGLNVTPGYINNDKANKESFTSDGYFRTGDRGTLDSEGYLTLTGRLKELINRAGEKISPLEVDAALLGCEGVGEAVCFGVADTKYGEKVRLLPARGAEGELMRRSCRSGRRWCSRVARRRARGSSSALCGRRSRPYVPRRVRYLLADVSLRSSSALSAFSSSRRSPRRRRERSSARLSLCVVILFDTRAKLMVSPADQVRQRGQGEQRAQGEAVDAKLVIVNSGHRLFVVDGAGLQAVSMLWSIA